jgi:MSHA biogenesis protein MshJ
VSALWTTVSAKIDARSVRERALVLAVLCVVAGGFGYLTMLGPTKAASAKLRSELNAKEQEIATVTTQAVAMAKDRVDPDRANKIRIEQIKQLISESELGLQKKRDRIVPADRVARLLEEVLARNGKLQLIDLKSLPAKPLFDPKEREVSEAAAPSGAKSASDEAKDQVRGIYRHGIEIRVRGSYLELLSYLSELERLPMQVFWSDVALEVKDFPLAEMKVILFTVSFDKVWMAV